MQLEKDRVLNASMYQKVETSSEEDLVYLLAPYISSLQTGRQISTGLQRPFAY